jgi:hypothetical protein
MIGLKPTESNLSSEWKNNLSCSGYKEGLLQVTSKTKYLFKN